MELFNQITAIINRNIDWPYEIKPDDNLRKDLEIDSLDVIIIVQEIEDEFDIIIEKEDINCLETVQNIVDKLSQKLDYKMVT